MGPCPPGTQVTVDMRFCEPCKGDDFNLVAGGVCRPCPMGAKCTEGYRIEALPDWWCVLAHVACRSSTQAPLLPQACCKHFGHSVLVSAALLLSVGAGCRRSCLRVGVRARHAHCIFLWLRRFAAATPARYAQSAVLAFTRGVRSRPDSPVCACVSANNCVCTGHECKKCTTDFRWVMPVAGFFAACCFFAGEYSHAHPCAAHADCSSQPSSSCLFVLRTLILLSASRSPLRCFRNVWPRRSGHAVAMLLRVLHLAGARPDQGLRRQMAPAVPGCLHVVFRRAEHRRRDDGTVLRRSAGASGIARTTRAEIVPGTARNPGTLTPPQPAVFPKQVDFYSAYVTTMLLPLGALVLCGSMWCVPAVFMHPLISSECCLLSSGWSTML